MGVLIAPFRRAITSNPRQPSSPRRRGGRAFTPTRTASSSSSSPPHAPKPETIPAPGEEDGSSPPFHTSLVPTDSDVPVPLLLVFLLLLLLLLARAHTHLTRPAPTPGKGPLLSNSSPATDHTVPGYYLLPAEPGDRFHLHPSPGSPNPIKSNHRDAMPKATNRRRKRGADGEGGADGSANKRSATSVLTSLDVNDAPRPELPLFQLNGLGSDRRGQGEEEEEEEVTGGGGRPSAPAASASGQNPHQQRRLWVKDRSRAWWEQCSSADYPEADFRAAFRMSRATFAMLCDALGSAVAKEDTALRAAIPVRQRVAVCVWRLATGEPLRLVSKRFGLGISTCHKLVLEVCAAIRNLLMPRFLRWPDAAAADGFKARFQADSGIPGVVGAIYTTHIPIIAPKVSVAAYFNRRHTERNHKTSYSITLQGVVGPDGAFTDVCIGWPGSMPDDQVLDRSALQQRAAAGMMVGSWVVGGASFPLTEWVLAPYAQPNLTWAQHAFNEKVAELRRVAVDAFARLKGRWACLQKRTEVKLQDLPVVLGACCVLHNICESRGEEMDPVLRCELADDETVPESPVRSDIASKARDDIAHNLLHSGLAGTKFF